ncbi:MAG: hypothetical protein CVV48_16680 [Spirochaetae bacterium HGW-Spirochaetae-4]|nr:MAG: hypothetical protein A2Y31_06290 [Spirochaetes bacterium GWC2_52_13]PKL11092.1 MAG: hypothetical protein CVV52_15165 [Spirochaetae bacterium HGW-Spirochaetae-8]PKL19705.1 MAG: hypothetical protein CVV48_16680 [Spirochaetae bacterium HGW-Spirochaetae-4]HCG63885.1 hypothetical protein [Sphaerochaeta sp.]HCS36010.1 hypothetical protein [Sphaerochaeta sp.]
MNRLTARETKERLDALMKDPQTLYLGDIVNRRGRCLGTEVPYSEIVAKRLLHTHAFPDVLKALPKVPRGYDFIAKDHDGTTLDPTILGLQQESRVAVALYNHKILGKLGKVIDYLVPIDIEGKHVGIIDLVTFDAETSTVFVIGYAYNEEKRETLLRCSLDIATMRNSLDDNRFIQAYHGKLVGEHGAPVDLKEIKIESAVLLLEGSYQDRSIVVLKRMPHVADLLHDLGIRLFVVGIALELRDKPRFTRKHSLYPYKPVLNYVPVLRERSIPVL